MLTSTSDSFKPLAVTLFNLIPCCAFGVVLTGHPVLGEVAKELNNLNLYTPCLTVDR